MLVIELRQSSMTVGVSERCAAFNSRNGGFQAQNDGEGTMDFLLDLTVALVVAIVLVAIPFMMRADRESGAAFHRWPPAHQGHVHRPVR
jgi:hypothetical protein